MATNATPTTTTDNRICLHNDARHILSQQRATNAAEKAVWTSKHWCDKVGAGKAHHFRTKDESAANSSLPWAGAVEFALFPMTNTNRLEQAVALRA